MVQFLFKIEQAYINISHPDFIGTSGAINNITEILVEERVKEREDQIIQEYQERQDLINNYTKTPPQNHGNEPPPNDKQQTTNNNDNTKLYWSDNLNSYGNIKKSSKKNQKKKKNRFYCKCLKLYDLKGSFQKKKNLKHN